jgi:hypothetical protein
MDLDTIMPSPEVNILAAALETATTDNNNNNNVPDLYVTYDRSKDEYGHDKVNSGVFMLRSTAWSKAFLEKVWQHNDRGKGNSDQESINQVLGQLTQQQRKQRIAVLDRRVFNAFPDVSTSYIAVQDWAPPPVKGDASTTDSLVLHFAGGYAGSQRTGMLLQFLDYFTRTHAQFLGRIVDAGMDDAVDARMAVSTDKAIDLVQRVHAIAYGVVMRGGRALENAAETTNALAKMALLMNELVVPTLAESSTPAE